MYLIYFDESGNTGNNLSDSQQPIFVLAALLVPDDSWQLLEKELNESFLKHFPDLFRGGVEVHATEIASGRNEFKGTDLSKRIRFRDEWMSLAKRHDLKVVYRAISKSKYLKWQMNAFGSGVSINPQVAAFALIASVLDDYLKSKNELGMFIFDDNKEVTKDIEKSLKILKGDKREIKIENVIEKGFFIDSGKSRVLQLCDLFAFAARKKEEFEQLGRKFKHVEASAIPILDSVTHSGTEKLLDVLDWLSDNHIGS